MVYNITIAGVNRDLQLCRLNDSLMIAGLIIYGDVELTCRSAEALLKKAPDFDYLIAPEAKAIPLIHEMARQSGRNEYILARKSPKLYMKDIFEVEVQSITTAGTQKLYLDGADAAKMKSKRILIVDDVVSTGESLRAVEALVNKAGGIIVGKMAILAEGEAVNRTDLIYLAPLPLFDSNGKPL
ncbi:MAG: adenine phosphoribosyltransferase [Clostridiales bacterium]|jgi:adenine phosphoribosyltransferase|nr:adenine phosphoribosyltransferase [Clostridiales bacterium]